MQGIKLKPDELSDIEDLYCSKFKGEDLSGREFGSLTAISHIGRGKYVRWNCKCCCGNSCLKSPQQLKSDPNAKCPKCNILHLSKIRRRWYQDISGTKFCQIRRTANKKKIRFDISKEDIWFQYIKQNKKCFYSNIDINFRDINDASVDRVDSDLDYTIDNIVICHKYINMMKNDKSIEYFLHLAELVLNPVKEINLGYNIITEKYGHFIGSGNLGNQFVSRTICRARNSNIIFNVTTEELWNLYIEQRGLCNITGLKINLPKFSRDKNWTASIDRIDSSKYYTLDNIQWIHKDINEMKWILNMNNFRYWCELIIKNKEDIIGKINL